MDESSIPIFVATAAGALIVSITIVIAYFKGMFRGSRRQSSHDSVNKSTREKIEPITRKDTRAFQEIKNEAAVDMILPVQEAPDPFSENYTPVKVVGDSLDFSVKQTRDSFISAPLLVVKIPRRKVRHRSKAQNGRAMTTSAKRKQTS